MSKRNFILLAIVLIIIMVAVLSYLYFRQPTGPTGDDAGGINFGSIFNPFNNPPQKPPTTTTPPEEVPTPINPIPEEKLRLTKVSSMPIAGYTVFQKERLKDVVITPPLTPPADTPTPTETKAPKPTPPATEFMPSLRYVERATGNIFQTFADKIQERRFSTTLIPKIYEALFGIKGESVVMRYLKINGRTIITFVGNLPKEYLGQDTESTEIKGTFLPENIKDVSLSPDSSSIFYLFNSGDNILGTTLNLTTNKKMQIFESPFTEWLSWWGNNNVITLTTKPASGIMGYAYVIDPSKNTFNQVLGKVNGLTTLASPNGKLILYGNDNLSLNIFHTDTKVSETVGVKTLPEKCVWGSGSNVLYCAAPKTIYSGLYPDAWYQGEISFEDQIWKINVETGNTSMVIDPITVVGGEEIDGIKLAMDKEENYLFFVNKKDSYLWELNLQ